MQSIKLTANVPVDLALRTVQGIDARSRTKGMQRMFQTTDGRAVYVSQQEGYEIETRIAELGIRAGERILLYKERVYGAGGVLTTKMNVYRAVVRVGQKSDGTFIVPRGPGALEGSR